MDCTGPQLRFHFAAEVTVMAKHSGPSITDSLRFPDETITFLKNLTINNNNLNWFARKKSVYEQAIKQPAERFCSLMTDELSQLTDDRTIAQFKDFPHQRR